MSITPNVLATRYATAEMVAIFDPINKIIAERKFWITILKLQKKAGLPITDADISAYEKILYKVDLALEIFSLQPGRYSYIGLA